MPHPPVSSHTRLPSCFARGKGERDGIGGWERRRRRGKETAAGKNEQITTAPSRSCSSDWFLSKVMASNYGKLWKSVKCATFSRKFSSAITSVRSDKPHIIRQLTCYNEVNLRLLKWLPAEEFAEHNQFLYEVVPGRLLRPADLASGPRVMQSLIGSKVLRQGISLVAVNLLNGRNVSHLMKSGNVLFSTDGDICLRATHLPHEEELEGTEHNHLAFKACHDLFFGETGFSGMLGKSAELVFGRSLSDHELPPDLSELRGYLLDSALVDKRLITNHQSQMFPEEISQLILLTNQFTRNEAAAAPDFDHRRFLAGKIFKALGKLVPYGLQGMHPLFDYWLSHAKFLGQLINLVDGDGSGGSLPNSPNNYFNGLMLMALLRTSVMHPFGPLRARTKLKEICSEEEQLDLIVPFEGEYTFAELQELIRFKIPMFGPTVQLQFMGSGFESKIDINSSSKPAYLKWNDTCPQNQLIKKTSAGVFVPASYQISGTGFK